MRESDKYLALSAMTAALAPIEITNTYSEMPPISYDSGKSRTYVKTELTPKQRKARAATKRAKKARRKNRS